MLGGAHELVAADEQRAEIHFSRQKGRAGLDWLAVALLAFGSALR